MAVITQIQLRKGTAAAWSSANPVLALGEPGIETDTRKMKFGDGSTAWNSLSYLSSDATSYTHTQGSASASWTITHNLGRKVQVTLFTVGGVEMLGDITHTSTNVATVTFVSAVAGSALVL
jgi:hypothetical protein